MPKVLFHDGFGQYGSAADVATRVLSTVGIALTTPGPRDGAKWVSNGNLRIAASTSSLYGSVGRRCKVVSLTSPTIAAQIQDPLGNQQADITIASSGAIAVYRFTTLLGQSPAGVISVGSEYFLEAKFHIHNTEGAVEVFVNGASVVLVEDVDTQYSSSAGWGAVLFNDLSRSYLSDVYVADDGDGDWDILGECQTDFHQLNGDGNSSAWTRSTGAVQYATIDEVPVSATDYNGTATVGDKDTMALEALKETGAEIVAVTPVVFAWKEAPGSALIKTVVRRGTTDYASATAVAPSEGSANARHLSDLPLMTDPSTALPWTETDFNGMEVGYEKVS